MKSLIQHNFFIALFLLFLTNGLNAKNIEVKENLPLDQQLKLPNSTYVFKGKCRLSANCTIPPNCQLVFEGGMIEGPYTLTGTNSYINAAPYCIFSSEVAIRGTWINNICYAEWFGAIGDGVKDDREALQKALDTKISVLELLPKTYLIGSYSDVKNKVGLKVPTKKSIIGHAVDDWSQEYSLNAKKGVTFNVLLQITGVHVTIKGVGVFGARSRDYNAYTVKDCIATLQDNYYTGLHLEYVFVSGCKENGINLYTYNTRLENCYVTNCDVAYYIHGGNGQGTSVHLLMCTAERARKNAYRIEKMSYSVLEVCAADHCALGTTTNTHGRGDEYGYNYYYFGCRGVSEISCGHEAGGYSHYFVNCRGMSIQTGRYTNSGLRNYMDWNDNMLKDMWVIKDSRDIEISQTTFASPMLDGGKVMTIDHNSSNIKVVQGFYVNQNSRFESISAAHVAGYTDRIEF